MNSPEDELFFQQAEMQFAADDIATAVDAEATVLVYSMQATDAEFRAAEASTPEQRLGAERDADEAHRQTIAAKTAASRFMYEMGILLDLD